MITPPDDDCTLTIRAFDAPEQCAAELTDPVASGAIVPDGNCNAVAVLQGDASLLPGNYIATCTAAGDVRFLESGQPEFPAGGRRDWRWVTGSSPPAR